MKKDLITFMAFLTVFISIYLIGRHIIVLYMFIFYLVVQCIYYIKLNAKLKNQIAKNKNEFIEILRDNLQTPILAQLRSMEILEQNANLLSRKEKNALVSETKNSCNYVLKMICNILHSYKLEEKSYKLNLENFNVNALIQDCLEELDSAKYSLQTNFDGMINADKLLISELLKLTVELLAIYSDKNDKISVKLEKQGNVLNFLFITTGLCMTAQNDKFYTIGEKIRLNTAKNIIRLLKGSFLIERKNKNLNILTLQIPLNAVVDIHCAIPHSIIPQMSY